MGHAASPTYERSRGQLERYFDQTARKAWEDLTSDVPVSGIRATVRAGRDEMRAVLLASMPLDMTGMRLLDAGCGTGALAIAAAERGAHVTAIDISRGLVDVARKRAPEHLAIDWRVGDMSDPHLGIFDHVAAMDSLIHYEREDMLRVLRSMATRANHIAFTFAPATVPLRAMHLAGKLFPRSDRSPRIKPVGETRLAARIGETLPEWHIDFSTRVSRGFYKSQAMGVSRR